MPFAIKDLHELEYDLCHAVVYHRDAELTVMLSAGHEQALSLPNEFFAEIDFRSVIRFEVGLDEDESQSGLFPTDDPAVNLIDGTVQNHLEIGPEHILIDVRIQNGPELVTFCSEDFANEVPPVGTRLKAWVQGLSIHPVFT
jgi:hypothetical protein